MMGHNVVFSFFYVIDTAIPNGLPDTPFSSTQHIGCRLPALLNKTRAVRRQGSMSFGSLPLTVTK